MNTFRVLAMSFLIALSSGVADANLIINGDFENNSAVTTQFNLSNTEFDAFVSNATAFGTAQEIDLVTDNNYGIAPESGNWKLGLHTQQDLGNFDGFSLALSSAVIGGMPYDLMFFAAQLDPAMGGNAAPGPVQIGLSNSATDFGALIFSGTPTSFAAWTQFDNSFTPSSGASFLTVRTDPTVFNDYAFVDNFTLVPTTTVPEPSTILLLGCGLAGVGLLRRRFKK